MTSYSIWQDGDIKAYGKLEADSKEKNAIERMQQMYFLVKELLIKEKPDYILLEHSQFQQNFRVYGSLSQLQGVLFSLLFERDIPFNLIEPTAWRKTSGVTGKRRADQKASAIQIVKEKYGIEASEDECEAVLIGAWGVEKIKPAKETE